MLGLTVNLLIKHLIVHFQGQFKKHNRNILEWFGLEGDHKNHLVPSSLSGGVAVLLLPKITINMLFALITVINYVACAYLYNFEKLRLYLAK